MGRLLPAAALLLLAGAAADAAPQDAGGGAPPAPAPGPQPAPAKKPPKEPSRAVASRIEESLRGLFAGSVASRLSSRAGLESAVADWAAESKEDPLRAVRWWRAALAAALPSGTHRAGISQESYAYMEGRTANLWVSVPKSYSPKGMFPLILAILEKGEDPKRVLPALYGDILKDWLVVAVVAEPKDAGIDVVKEPWMAAVGLRYAVEHLRVDRDRVVLDASAPVSNLALSLAAEWSVQFAGCILRGPTASSPLVSNLGMCGTMVLESEPSTDAQKKVLAEVRAAAPGTVVAPEGKASAQAVQEWLAKLPPRKVAAAESAAFSWKTRPQGGEPWAYWLWVFRASDTRKEKFVSVKFSRDAAGGIVDLVAENLAEGILLVNDDLLDLDRELTVRVNGKEAWKGKAERSVRTAVYWIGQTGERTLFAPAEIRFTVPVEAQPPKKDGGGGAPAPPPPPPPPPGKGGSGGG